jgi:hypothetical protein
MADTRYDENLLVIFAVEEYARRQKTPAHETSRFPLIWHN